MSDDGDLMVEYYEAGWTLREIGSHLHYGHVTVRRVLIARGVRLRGRGQRNGTTRLAHAEFERTRVLRRAGLSLGEIGTCLSRSEAAICERLKKAA